MEGTCRELRDRDRGRIDRQREKKRREKERLTQKVRERDREIERGRRFLGAASGWNFSRHLLPPTGEGVGPRDRGVVFVQRHDVSAACGLFGIKPGVPRIPPVIATRARARSFAHSLAAHAETIAFSDRVTA